jgi:hypothetical protein
LSQFSSFSSNDHSVGDQLPGQFDAIPLAHRYSRVIRPLAGQFDQMDGHLGGKKSAVDLSVCRP